MKRILAIMVTGSLVLWGCGSDDDGDSGGSDGGAAQTELADLLVAQVDGVGIDEQCLRDKTDELSDEDAQFLIDNIDATDTEGFSTELQAWADGLVECLGDAGVTDTTDE